MLNRLAAGFVVVRVLMFLGFGIYQSMWRYISTFDATRLAAAVAASVPVFVSLTYLSAI